MYVYSGDCRKCEVGVETNLFDWSGELLNTGDIVISICDGLYNSGLTVVIADQWQSYSDGTHVKKDGDLEFFVMGIKSEVLGERWQAVRVKKFEDAIEGEHWTDYGFSYKST